VAQAVQVGVLDTRRGDSAGAIERATSPLSWDSYKAARRDLSLRARRRSEAEGVCGGRGQQARESRMLRTVKSWDWSGQGRASGRRAG
jgi:hypothetical protein